MMTHNNEDRQQKNQDYIDYVPKNPTKSSVLLPYVVLTTLTFIFLANRDVDGNTYTNVIQLCSTTAELKMAK